MNRWTWRFERSDGSVVTDVPESTPEWFPAQADAESWIGETWAALLESGVDAVTLLEGERVVYGPMSLHPPA